MKQEKSIFINSCFKIVIKMKHYLKLVSLTIVYLGLVITNLSSTKAFNEKNKFAKNYFILIIYSCKTYIVRNIILLLLVKLYKFNSSSTLVH